LLWVRGLYSDARSSLIGTSTILIFVLLIESHYLS
jgi:hypothetical protein